MARAVSDRTLAGRRMHGGLVPRNGAKKDAKPPPTKNLLCGVAYFAPLREIRQPRPHFRGGHTERRPSPFGQHAPGFRVLREMEPGAGSRETGNGRFRIRTSGACCPNRSDAVPTLPRETRSPGPARGASLRSGSEIRSGIPSSRAPALRAERRRPNAEVRSAKCEVRSANGTHHPDMLNSSGWSRTHFRVDSRNSLSRIIVQLPS